MTTSKRIASLLGPTLVVMTASESRFVQPHLYDEQIPPVVYLSGVLLFVAGLAIVRWHNVWRRDWTVLITVCGWGLLVLGMVRMFATGLYRQASGHAGSAFLVFVETILFVIGLVLTWKGYARDVM